MIRFILIGLCSKRGTADPCLPHRHPASPHGRMRGWDDHGRWRRQIVRMRQWQDVMRSACPTARWARIAWSAPVRR